MIELCLLNKYPRRQVRTGQFMFCAIHGSRVNLENSLIRPAQLVSLLVVFFLASVSTSTAVIVEWFEVLGGADGCNMSAIIFGLSILRH